MVDTTVTLTPRRSSSSLYGACWQVSVKDHVEPVEVGVGNRQGAGASSGVLIAVRRETIASSQREEMR
jgi:hypothetical protein